jgi:alkaline phosphatase
VLKTRNVDAMPASPPIRVNDGHTGDEVLVAARGLGAKRVHGFIANTDLFHIRLVRFTCTRSGRDRYLFR